MAPASALADPPPPSGVVDLSTDAALTLMGAGAADQTGLAIAPAGDVNGDGKPDVIVGAPASDPHGRDHAGSAFVVLWPAQGSQRLGDADLPVLRIDGAHAGDAAGFAVASAGDVNGDGLDDVVVGAPRADGPPYTDVGAAYIVFGEAAGGHVDLATLTPDQGYRIAGRAAGDKTGAAVAGLGDVNGDKIPDVVVGAPRVDEADRPGAGAAFVVFGSRPGADVDLAALGTGGFEIQGATPDAFTGTAVAAAPDSNGDGRPEIIVGAPREAGAGGASVGGVHVVLGRETTDPVDLAAPSDTVTERHGGKDDLFGLSVAAAGDPDGDGKPDMIIGAPGASAKDRAGAGAAYLMPLGDGPALPIRGAQPGDRLGAHVAGMGDVNGDGLDDVAVTAPFTSPLSRDGAGSGYLVFGAKPEATTAQAGSEPEAIDVAGGGQRVVVLAGANSHNRVLSIAGPGDLDGDKTADVLVGSLGDGQEHGVIHLVRGFSPPPPPPVLPPDPGRAEEVALDGCHAAKSLEILVDDSGSMSDTDPENLRERGIELLLTKERDVGKQLGAVEFGSETDRLFPPQPIQTGDAGDEQFADLARVLRKSVLADNGGTNYNAGFSVLTSENPDADARIFITDGGHNEGGRYANGHAGGPPTYVIGLGIGLTGRDGRRLARIAAETKGLYFPRVTAASLQAVINAIDSTTNCDIGQDSFFDLLTDHDPTGVSDDIDIENGTHSVEIDTTWTDTGDDIDPGNIDVLDDGNDVVDTIEATKLRRAIRTDKPVQDGQFVIRGTKGPTFFTLHITGVRAKGLRVHVRAHKVRGRSASVRTQILQSRRRH